METKHSGTEDRVRPQNNHLDEKDAKELQAARDCLSTTYSRYTDGNSGPLEKYGLVTAIRKVGEAFPDLSKVYVNYLIQDEKKLFFVGLIGAAEYLDDFLLALDFGYSFSILAPIDSALNHIAQRVDKKTRETSLRQFKKGLIAIVDKARQIGLENLAESLAAKYLNKTDALLAEYETCRNPQQAAGGPETGH